MPATPFTESGNVGVDRNADNADTADLKRIFSGDNHLKSVMIVSNTSYTFCNSWAVIQ